MKHYYCVALALCFWGYGFSQSTQQRGTPMKLQPAKSSVSASTTPASVSSQPTDSLAGMTPEHCQNVIDAIDSKVAMVQSDQSQNEQALANGWYERMARNRAAWVANRDELLRRRNSQEK